MSPNPHADARLSPPDSLGGLGDGGTLPGFDVVTAADLLDPARARRNCGASRADLRLLDDYADFFATKLPAASSFVTLTWRSTPEQPQTIGKIKRRHRIHGYRTPTSAFRASHKLFRDCQVKTPSLWAAERVTASEAVHLHGLTRRLEGADRNAVFVTAVKRFGSIKILDADPRAFPYVCKYLFKSDSCGRHDWLDLSGLRR